VTWIGLRARASKALGIVAGLALPFFFVFVVGLIFDKKTGGDPFYATVFVMYFLSPLWLGIGIVLAVKGFRREKVRRGLFRAYGILVIVIVLVVIVVALANFLTGSKPG
jgi:hypothetical protein